MADLGLYRNLIERARIEEELNHRRLMRELRTPERSFEMPDKTFVGIYRLKKDVVLDLVREIEPYMPPITGFGMSNVTKVLTALNFYASGSYQRFVGIGQSMHQTSVSNVMRAVTEALNHNHFREKYLVFPQTIQARNLIKQGFYDKFGMPGIVGCVDGTHIAIVKPWEFEERFFNRKGYHSINTQIICDSDLNILSIDASHGGRNHDSFIWNQHPIRTHMENLFQTQNESSWLLGDSGYPLRPYLLTPMTNTNPDTPERRYTDLQCKVRNCVERCIGVLKARWRCLLVHRVLHYEPTTAGYIANACAILHNVANLRGIAAPQMPRIDMENEAALQIIHNHAEAANRGRNPELAAGEATRRSLIDRLFN